MGNTSSYDLNPMRVLRKFSGWQLLDKTRMIHWGLEALLVIENLGSG